MKYYFFFINTLLLSHTRVVFRSILSNSIHFVLQSTSVYFSSFGPLQSNSVHSAFSLSLSLIISCNSALGWWSFISSLWVVLVSSFYITHFILKITFYLLSFKLDQQYSILFLYPYMDMEGIVFLRTSKLGCLGVYIRGLWMTSLAKL